MNHYVFLELHAALKTSCLFKQGTRENKGSRPPTFPAPSPLSLASSIFPFSPFGRPQQHYPTKASVQCPPPDPTTPYMAQPVKEGKQKSHGLYLHLPSCRVKLP